MQGFDYNALDFWWNVLQILFLGVIAIHTWLVNRTKAHREAIDAVDEKVGGLHRRVTLIEHELVHLLGDQAIARIHSRIDQVGQGVRHLESEMKQVNHTLYLIQQHLLEGSN